MRKINTLTGLRFLAALYVFVFHLNMPNRTPLTWLPEWAQTFLEQGSLGVTIFFVLSGLVLTFSHLKDFPQATVPGLNYWGRFLYKRLARIYPAFLVGLVLMVVLTRQLHTFPSRRIVLFCATFTQTYLKSTAMQWYDSGTWSVANEWFFYLLFPLLLPLTLRYLRSSRAVLGALVGVLLAQAAFIIAISFHPSWHEHIEFFCFPPARLAEFITGILVGLGVRRYNWRVPPMLAVVAVVAEGIWIAHTPDSFSVNRLLHHIDLVPVLAVLFIALCQPQPAPIFSWLAWRPLQYLGEISYCFYIVQIPLLFLLEALINNGTLQHTDFTVFPIGLVVNLLAAAALYHWVELPAHTWLLGRMSQPVRSLPEKERSHL